MVAKTLVTRLPQANLFVKSSKKLTHLFKYLRVIPEHLFYTTTTKGAVMDISRIVATAHLHNLSLNPYPGRGLIIGTDETGKFMVQVYWIMGRSANSRNRVFGSDDEFGRLFTEAADPAKMEDPRLVIYNAMAEYGDRYVVSNGDQTDDIVSIKQWRYSFQDALFTRQYEPDQPNFTPRISGQCFAGKDGAPPFQLAILRKSAFGDSCDKAFYEYSEIIPGYGYCITTYTGDRNPLPPWQGDPLLMPLTGSIEEIADMYHGILNEEHFVSLAVKFIPLDYGKSRICIINKYKKV